MNRLQYVIAALVAVAGVGSAFTTNQKKTKKVLTNYFWYFPSNFNVTVFTGDTIDAWFACPLVSPQICLVGFTLPYRQNPGQTYAVFVTGEFFP